MPLRLFISGLSTRLGFDIETIEDIKTVVSEVCVLLFRDVSEGEFEVIINAEKNLDITAKLISAKYAECEEDDGTIELSKMLVEALADETYIMTNDSGNIDKVRIVFNLGE